MMQREKSKTVALFERRNMGINGVPNLNSNQGADQ